MPEPITCIVLGVVWGSKLLSRKSEAAEADRTNKKTCPFDSIHGIYKKTLGAECPVPEKIRTKYTKTVSPGNQVFVARLVGDCGGELLNQIPSPKDITIPSKVNQESNWPVRCMS